jgi:hypothetical protein
MSRDPLLNEPAPSYVVFVAQTTWLIKELSKSSLHRYTGCSGLLTILIDSPPQIVVWITNLRHKIGWDGGRSPVMILINDNKVHIG